MEQITDVDLAVSVERCRKLLQTPWEKEHDREYCRITREILWHAILAAQTLGRQRVREELKGVIEEVIPEAIGRIQDGYYLKRSTARQKSLDTYLRTGVLNLSAEAKKYIKEEFGPGAIELIEEIERKQVGPESKINVAF